MMFSRRTLMVRTSAVNGERAYVVACDDATLGWLGTAFRRLRDGKSFRLGDGQPIGSDGKFVIEVVAGAGQSFVETSPKFFRWVLPWPQARHYAGLIGAIADCSGPCHHYLEGEKPDLPVVIVSKDEYDAAILRQMRDGHP